MTPVPMASSAGEPEGLTLEDLNLEPSPLIEGWRVEYCEQGRNGPGVYAYYKDMHCEEDCHFLLPIPPAASLREQEPLSDQQKLDAFTSACIFDDDPLADAFYKGIEFAEKHHGIDAQRLGRGKAAPQEGGEK